MEVIATRVKVTVASVEVTVTSVKVMSQSVYSIKCRMIHHCVHMHAQSQFQFLSKRQNSAWSTVKAQKINRNAFNGQKSAGYRKINGVSKVNHLYPF